MKNEILFRALSDYDQVNYDNNDDMKCLLLKSNEDAGSKSKSEIQEYYDLCIQGKGEYALDTIVGHVQGGKLKNETSCWISTTSNFDLACSEYAVPQSGNYNQSDKRKNIISIEVEKNKIYSDSKKIKQLRDKTIPDDVFIDLRNSKLNEYYNKCIYSETFNIDMPGYNFVKDANREFFGLTTTVNGFSNFATRVEEVLAYKNIRNSLIKDIYYPIQQDILYGTGTVTNLDLNLLSSIVSTLDISEKILFNLLYPSLEQGNNLTDILFENYRFINGQTIQEKYHILKVKKYQLLDSIVKKLNSKSLVYNLSLNRLIDNQILVYSFDRKLSKSAVNDVVIVEFEGDLYRYNHEDNCYVGEKGKILKKELIKNI